MVWPARRMDSRLPWRSGKARRHSRRPNRLLPICRTPTFELFQNTKPQNPLKRGLCGLARPERFELPTPRFEAWCSIQLSYGRRGAYPKCGGALSQEECPYSQRSLAATLSLCHTFSLRQGHPSILRVTYDRLIRSTPTNDLTNIFSRSAHRKRAPNRLPR